MENFDWSKYSEDLKKTLRLYQLSSADSLSGPNNYSAVSAQLWFKENQLSPPIQTLLPTEAPLFMPKDTSTRRSETILAGVPIACFDIAGEKRLCLPQILMTVLRDFSILEINRACIELHIYCSRCSSDQLKIFKAIGILPHDITQCGLITKTDAERLVSFLSLECHSVAKQHNPVNEGCEGVPVYHECFGRGNGVFYPELYIHPTAACISCKQCKITLPPSKFVSHSHGCLEKHTCHWGFDSENWRNYMLLSEETESLKRSELEEILNEIKSKFYGKPTSTLYNYRSPAYLKRRSNAECNDQPGKRLKNANSEDNKYFSSNLVPTRPLENPYLGIRRSAFKPCYPIASKFNVPHVTNISAHQAHIQPLDRLTRHRQFFPSHLQLDPPAIRTPQDISKWVGCWGKTPPPPNITLAPAEYQRIASIRMDNKRRRIMAPKSERQDQNGIRRKLDLSKRNSGLRSSSTPQKGEICDTPLISSILKPTSLFRDSPLNVTKVASKVSRESLHHAFLTKIVPTDDSQKQFRWNFDTSSYIISAAGTKELNGYCSLLETIECTAPLKDQLLQEVVRMKCRHEKNLCIEEEARHDIEEELEWLKNVNKQFLRYATDAEQRIRDEIEAMRRRYKVRISDANNSLLELQEKLARSRNSSEQLDETDFLENLREEITKQDERANYSQAEVVNERKEEKLKLKLKEFFNSSERTFNKNHARIKEV